MADESVSSMFEWVVSKNRIYYTFPNKLESHETTQAPSKAYHIRSIHHDSDSPYATVTRSPSQLALPDSGTSESLVLGVGLHGKVDVVTPIHVGPADTHQFARKEYISNSTDDDDEEQSEKPKARRNFEDEVKILHRLDVEQPTEHRVKIHDAYTIDNKRWFLIIDPVANGGTLENMLIRFAFARSTKTADEVAVLQRSIGCLIVALACLHAKGFRHRDLHPGNILFHNGDVLLCDFSASLHVDHGQRSTTTTYFPPRMERYAAPEVISTQGQRNRMTDIFSLGAILLEIVLAIHQPDILARILSDGGWRYESRLDEVHAMTSLSSSLYHYASFSIMLGDMMSLKKEKRPAADQVAAELIFQSRRPRGGTQSIMCAKCKSWICDTGIPQMIEDREEELRNRWLLKSSVVRSKSQ